MEDRASKAIGSSKQTYPNWDPPASQRTYRCFVPPYFCICASTFTALKIGLVWVGFVRPGLNSEVDHGPVVVSIYLALPRMLDWALRQPL